MPPPLTPLLFHPVYKDYLWGGCQLAQRFGRQDAPSRCAESWEVSAHPDGPSRVACGPLAGARLDELAAAYGAALTGTRAPCPERFPLLAKLIDAREALSVQVHPNEANAALTGGEPKTEMWVVLDRAPGARLYAGLAAGVSPDSLRAGLAAGTAERCLVRLDVDPGQALFIPGGLVHAIGAGCLIYEVQQNSNTTYRLYDWNRTGPDGRPRPLHLAESFRTIDWSLPAPTMRPPLPEADSAVVSCPQFCVRRLRLARRLVRPTDGTTFHLLFVEHGRVAVSAGGLSVTLASGASALIPAAAPAYALEPAPDATLLVTTL